MKKFLSLFFILSLFISMSSLKAQELPSPTLNSPESNRRGLTLTPTFTWNSVDYATNYQIQIATDSDFYGISLDNETTELSFSIDYLNQLTPLVTYFWHIMGTNPTTYGTWSETWTFTTLTDMTVPLLYSPLNGEITAPIRPKFEWAFIEGAAGYRIQVSSTSDFITTIMDANVNDTYYTAAVTLSEYSTYFWRVRAVNDINTTDWSQTWSFTTIPPISGAYTVGTGGDYATLTDAVAAATLFGINGDLEFVVISDIEEPATGAIISNQWTEYGLGNYNLTISVGATPVTISSAVTGSGVISINDNARNIIIDGNYEGTRNLTLANTNMIDGGYGISFIAYDPSITPKNVIIRYCNIMCASNENTSTMGILFFGKMDNITFEYNKISRAFMGGMLMGGGPNATNLVIKNNIFGDDSPENYLNMVCIDGFNLEAPKILNNEFYNLKTGFNCPHEGIYLMFCNGAIIDGNSFHDIATYDVLPTDCVHLMFSPSYTLSNNIVYNINFAGVDQPAAYSAFLIDYGSTAGKIIHNTINFDGAYYLDGDNFISTCIFFASSDLTYNTDMINNVFVNGKTGNGTGYKNYCVYVNTIDPVNFNSIDYNDYYSYNEGAMLGYIGQDIPTLEGWRTTTGQDMHSLASDPVFTSGIDLMPVPVSPLIGAGLYLQDYHFDILGHDRPNPPTIGAYEYIMPPPVLISPENAMQDIVLTPTFEWSNLINATNYHLQVSKNLNFSTLIIDENISESSFTPLFNLEYDHSYFWRVQAMNESLTSVWSDTWSFTTIKFGWTLVTNTGNSSIVTVPVSINPMIGNRPFQTGDAIGLFYQQTPGIWTCGGFSVWDGNNLSITVWGDNINTTVKDGFSVGEIYSFHVWDNVAQTEYNANATFSVGPDNYQISAFSIVSSLTVIVPVTQEFNLPLGWSMISGNVNPFDPALNSIFGDVNGNIIIMKNGLGQNYIPGYNINQIGNWNKLNGYLIKVNAETQFSITGLPVIPEATPIPLIASWNLISYLRLTPMSIISAFNNLGNAVVICKNGLGQMYIPAYGINQIGNMNPGEGYYLNVNAAGNLLYPANGLLRMATNGDISPMPKLLLPKSIRTGSNASLLLNIISNDGNEIGIYNSDKELIGSGVVNNGLAAITIWGDDATTNAIEGAELGESLSVKLMDIVNGKMEDLKIDNIREILSNTGLDDLKYFNDGLFTAKGTIINVNSTGLSINNAPNPFSGSTMIHYTVSEKGNVNIQLYNLQGELVANIFNGSASVGGHDISFDSGDLTSGVYNIIMRFDSQQVTALMMIVK